MIIQNVYQAKSQLSALINAALAGEKVFISKAGTPKIKLVPVQKELTPRKPGALKGKIWISDDFTEESEEINELFYSSS